MLLVNFECYSEKHLESVLESEGEICGSYFCLVDRDEEAVSVYNIMPENLEVNKLTLSQDECRQIDLSGMMETEEDK